MRAGSFGRGMRQAAVGMGAVAVLAVPGMAEGQGMPVPTPQQPPTIMVNAVGEHRTTPDRASVMIAVQTRAATAAAASRENARIQRAVFDTLRAVGIPAEQLSTMGYSVQPEYRHDPRGGTPARVVGYVVHNMVRVEVRRLDQVGTVIDASLAKGANNINSLDFYVANRDAARREALSAAVSRARADAEAMARAAGGSLGQLLEMNSMEMDGPRPPIMYRRDAMMAEAASAAPTPVAPGEETVRASVMTRWAFVPGGR